MLKSIEFDNASFDHAQAERGLRGPGWRWRLARELPFSHWDPWMQHYDEHIRAARHFLELVGHSPVGAKQAEALYPQIVAAVALDRDAAKVAELKIAVFGDLPPAEIVRRMPVDATALQVWESLFYDARQLRRHIAWVSAQIVDAELAAGNVDLATKLQLVAAVGSRGATAILDAGSRATGKRRRAAIPQEAGFAAEVRPGDGHDGGPRARLPFRPALRESEDARAAAEDLGRETGREMQPSLAEARAAQLRAQACSNGQNTPRPPRR